MLDDIIDRFTSGFQMARDCWKILRDDKTLLLLPFFSGVACVAVVLSFIAPESLDHQGVLQGIVRLARFSNGEADSDSWKDWGTIFLFYFCLHFVIFFFNAALVHCCLFRIRGIKVNLFHGLLAAFRRLPLLVAWSVVSASVGLLIRIAEKASRDNQQFGRQFLFQIFGTLWSVATYFIVPVLVIERLGPVKALKRSVKVLTRTWGDQIGGHFGLTFFMLPIWLCGFAVIWLASRVGITTSTAGAMLLVAAVLWLILAGLVQSTLETVLLSALYLYATQDEIPEQWEASRLEQAFYTRTSYSES